MQQVICNSATPNQQPSCRSLVSGGQIRRNNKGCKCPTERTFSARDVGKKIFIIFIIWLVPISANFETIEVDDMIR